MTFVPTAVWGAVPGALWAIAALMVIEMHFGEDAVPSKHEE